MLVMTPREYPESRLLVKKAIAYSNIAMLRIVSQCCVEKFVLVECRNNNTFIKT